MPRKKSTSRPCTIATMAYVELTDQQDVVRMTLLQPKLDKKFKFTVLLAGASHADMRKLLGSTGKADLMVELCVQVKPTTTFVTTDDVLSVDHLVAATRNDERYRFSSVPQVINSRQ